ncbi:MAG: YjbH domain-containing protein [Paracoccaceae bacterium]|nr:MAG: YjbH domain-containing protein [Paracoccaceae bacterium]
MPVLQFIGSHRARALAATVSAVALLSLAIPSVAQDGGDAPRPRTSLNMYGATGLIDMPSGEAQPDGEISIATSHFGPISRTTLSFQITPRLSGSFRFLGVRDWNRNFCPPDCAGENQFDTYYDRSFDLRYQILKEGRYVPAVTIGLQDFAGTGVLAGEYIVATKNITPRFKATVGLGWGRLGSHGSIGSPFGVRPPIDIGFGGNFNTDTWFRGPAAPFGGIEWQVDDRWTLKAEYSSDAYAEEAGKRGTFERKSPLNLGVEYRAAPGATIGAYYMYGSTVGIAAQFAIDPKTRPGGGITEGAPASVIPRQSAGALGWSTAWVADPAQQTAQVERLKRLLADDGIQIEGLRSDAGRSELRIRNTRYDAGAQAVGRAARAMSRALPPSIDVFDIVLVSEGMATSTVTLRRSDIEALEFAPDGAAALRARARIDAAGARPAGMVRDPDLYPAFAWSLAPYQRFRLFDQRDPLKLDVGIRGTVRLDLAPGLRLEGSVTQKLAGNLDERPPLPDRGRLQPVRSAVYWYDAEGTTALEKLALHWNTKLGRDVYGRISVGYLERMFGGVSAEVLWKPAGSRFALGAEVNYVAQRSPDGGLGFNLPARLYETDNANPGGPDSYRVATGHVSAYYELAQGFHVQLDVGRYLAGDTGATLSIQREFANGWKVGAFATKTNVSAADFGSGSFDKGILIEVPLNWVIGQPSRQTSKSVLRPFGRDGGARLEVDGRLYEQVRGYHAPGLDRQWGRFWK